MIESGFGREKESHTISAWDFNHQEDIKTYGQLPDYDEFQGYDLGIDSELSQIDETIYVSFHKPSWRTLKRHLVLVGIPEKLLF